MYIFDARLIILLIEGLILNSYLSVPSSLILIPFPTSRFSSLIPSFPCKYPIMESLLDWGNWDGQWAVSSGVFTSR